MKQKHNKNSLKVVVINPPTIEEAKSLIEKISIKISKLYSHNNNVLEEIK